MRKLTILLVVALIASACTNTKSDDDRSNESLGSAFYKAPDPLPEGSPGDIIRTEEIAAPEGARAWRILYLSETVDDKSVAVSGFVVAPKDPGDSKRPILAWAHGTLGLADKCAPSKQDDAYTSVPALQRFLDAGYVIAATDYQGLGGPGLHPFFVGESEAKGILDSARAARNIKQTNASSDIALLGNTEGGNGVLFGGQIADSYAPELDVKGVASGTPSGSLDQLYGSVSQLGGFVGFVVMGIYGFAAGYPDQVRVSEILTEEGLQQSGIVEKECANEIAAALTQPVEELVARSPLEVEPWPQLIAENTPGNVPTPEPILLFQGDSDLLVLLSTTQELVTQLCSQGDTVELKTFRGSDNETVLTDAANDYVSWIADRFADKPAESSCG